MRYIFALLVLAVASVTAGANQPTFANGFTNTDGYVFQNGYWTWGGKAYTRSLVQGQGYYQHGCYYPGASYYQYSYAYDLQPAVSYKDVDWRTKLLEIAKQRDATEGAIRKNAFEQKYFLDGVQALGLTGNFNWQNYGLAPPYVGGGYNVGGYSNVGSYGVSGNTLYGYSYNTIANLYGDTNLNQLYQQANRLAENQQKLAGQATTEFGSLVGQAGDNASKVAEILAKGQAVEQYLKSLQQPSAKLETKTFSFKVMPDSDGKLQVQKIEGGPTVGVTNSMSWTQSAAKCFSCHQDKKREGGFDVRTYFDMTPEQKEVVIDRLTTKDPNRMMPKGGKRLSLEELKLWLQ